MHAKSNARQLESAGMNLVCKCRKQSMPSLCQAAGTNLECNIEKSMPSLCYAALVGSWIQLENISVYFFPLFFLPPPVQKKQLQQPLALSSSSPPLPSELSGSPERGLCVKATQLVDTLNCSTTCRSSLYYNVQGGSFNLSFHLL